MEFKMKPLSQLWVHDSARANALALRRRESLFRGELDQRFHYLTERQAQLWMEVHKQHAPLFHDPEFSNIFKNAAAELAADLAGESVHLIGLGAGGGEKEALVLSALRSAGCRVSYTPLDVSLELALLSAEAGAGQGGVKVTPVVGDLRALEDIQQWPGQSGGRRVFTAFGLAPNLMPGALYGRLAGALRPEDALLLSVNLAPVSKVNVPDDARKRACQEILPQYDNPETLRWLKQVLADWGISEALSEPVFAIQQLDSIWGIAANCHWLSDVTFDWEDALFKAEKGATLRIFYSLRYTPEDLRSVMQKNGLLLGAGYITACKQEGVWRAFRE
jgi:hypothetical protein